MYGKFFSSTFTGSMFGAGVSVFAVWGYVIANAIDGVVEVNPQLLAATLGTTPDDVDAALLVLSSPDPKSRSEAEEGRRLVYEAGYTYRVVNHAAYRAMRNEDDRRAYNREAKRRSRQSKSNSESLTVNDMSAVSAHTEAEAEAEAKTETEARAEERAVVRAPKGQPIQTKPSTLINGAELRLHGSHAWCSWPDRDGLCVPAFLHREFIGKLGRETADPDLRAWYPTVVAQFTGQAVGDDALDFWRNNFAGWVGIVTAAPQATKGTRTMAAMRRVIKARQGSA